MCNTIHIELTTELPGIHLVPAGPRGHSYFVLLESTLCSQSRGYMRVIDYMWRSFHFISWPSFPPFLSPLSPEILTSWRKLPLSASQDSLLFPPFLTPRNQDHHHHPPLSSHSPLVISLVHALALRAFPFTSSHEPPILAMFSVTTIPSAFSPGLKMAVSFSISILNFSCSILCISI